MNMTPEEKAIELTEKYSNLGSINIPDYDTCKKCALIAVEEILNEKTGNGKVACFSESCKFWGNVKEEINKL